MTDLGAPANGNGHQEPPRAQRCETCMWFKTHQKSAEGKVLLGACRRYPPVAMLVPVTDVKLGPKGPIQETTFQLQAPFPPMVPDSYCGEWAAADAAIIYRAWPAEKAAFGEKSE